MADLIDRDLYPAGVSAGQWEYQVFYVENFDAAVQGLAGNIENTVKAVFRRNDPEHLGKPARTAYVRKNGGWFGPGMPAPEMPADHAVLTDEDVQTYTASLSRNGFFGPCSYYMNHPANGTYALKSPTGCRLSMPVLFVHARYDTTCLTLDTALSEPARALRQFNGGCGRQWPLDGAGKTSRRKPHASDVVRLQGDVRMTRILEIRNTVVPIASDIRNAFIDFSKMTASVVAVITDAIVDGKPVVGYGFNSNGRYNAKGILEDRIIPRVLDADASSLSDPNTGLSAPTASGAWRCK